MIGKGLKVGDIFEDGDFSFVVEAIDDKGNYISRRLEEADILDVDEVFPGAEISLDGSEEIPFPEEEGDIKKRRHKAAV